MKVCHLSSSDCGGGAARAAYRIHRCLREARVDSRMAVDLATSGDWTVHGPEGGVGRIRVRIRRALGAQLTRLLRTENPILHSPAVVPSRWPAKLNKARDDIAHLHWVAGEMLSVRDIDRIRGPKLWTLHDMWAFCGAEHLTEDSRWRDGYLRGNRPRYESGFDLNRWAWARKRKLWRTPFQIVTPSRWLCDLVRGSALLRDWPVQVIPNPVDTEFWRPLAQHVARDLLRLPRDAPILMFGAMGGTQSRHKGFDLLQSALNHLRGDVSGLRILILGQAPPEIPPDLGFPVHYAGYLRDDISLRVAYCAADALVIPSRQDNLPNMGVEALACGTPVVAFDACGLPDIVEHQFNGYLATKYDPEELAGGIKWVVCKNRRPAPFGTPASVTGNPSGETQRPLSVNARARAVERFSYPVVAAQYLEVYRHVLAVGRSAG